MRASHRAFIRAMQNWGKHPQGKEPYGYPARFSRLHRFQAFIDQGVDYTKFLDHIWGWFEDDEPGQPAASFAPAASSGNRTGASSALQSWKPAPAQEVKQLCDPQALAKAKGLPSAKKQALAAIAASQ
eukprot:4588564-Amphidinium_carterae.2